MARPTKAASHLSKPKILKVALHLLDNQGIHGLTFRALAKQMQVTPMAITHHVGTRKQLLQALVHQVFHPVATTPLADTPQACIHAMLQQYGLMVMAHPNLVHAILADPTLMSKPLQHLTNQVRNQLKALNLPPSQIDLLLGIMIDYTHGFAFSATAYGGETASIPPLQIEDFQKGLTWILEAIDQGQS
ncbi:TetR/AcrR family transcriptional regulator [Magnetococcus sp. PR-3]|uniref:TetR/AcrR family transcriptional regulator n=1 Tax=Magnetococcus sp. PR-3 TaxID=3120355 RepID=UPI002FCE3698